MSERVDEINTFGTAVSAAAGEHGGVPGAAMGAHWNAPPAAPAGGQDFAVETRRGRDSINPSSRQRLCNVLRFIPSRRAARS